MNFLKDQKGIVRRYLREKEHWDEHLTNTRQYISTSVRLHKIRVVGILGSGWLLDVPIRELASECEKVYLVDVYLPMQVVHRVKQWPHVHLVRADITGGWIEKAFSWASKGLKTITGPEEISAEKPFFRSRKWFKAGFP